MKKVLFVIAALASSSVLAIAQDIITNTYGVDIKAKVLEVGIYEVKYKLYDEPEGATYIVKKSDILLIRYESGRNEVFNKTPYVADYSNREPVEGIVPGMEYKELKKLYNPKDYTPVMGDRYSPAWTGVASGFIPGLGECINGEWGRGLLKFAGVGIIQGIYQIGITYGWWGYYNPETERSYAEVPSTVIMLLCSIGIEVWSIIDAVQIAKIKNMYEQDLKKTYSFDMKVYPSINYINAGNTIQPIVGATLALQF